MAIRYCIVEKNIISLHCDSGTLREKTIDRFGIFNAN